MGRELTDERETLLPSQPSRNGYNVPSARRDRVRTGTPRFLFSGKAIVSKDPTILITGCSSGIGEALCREFHARGWQVIATARRLESLDGLRAEGMETLQLDVNNRDDITRVVGTVLEIRGHIDILVNNAGYGLMRPTIEVGDSDLRSQLETNLISPLALIREVAPGMKQRGRGKIVNIGSISGVVPTPFSGAYCASKAALHALSDTLRMELKPFGIQVITVQPGATGSQFGSTASRTARRYEYSGSWYESLQDAIHYRAELSQKNATPARDFARQLTGILLRKRPPPIVRLSKKSGLLPLLRLLLPVRALDAVLIRKFGLNMSPDNLGTRSR